MIRFLNRLGGGGPSGSVSSADSSPRHSDNERPSSNLSWNVEAASDPVEWERHFANSWRHVEAILDNPSPSITYDQVNRVYSHVMKMCGWLMMEVNAQPEPSIGPILDRYFTCQIMERVMDFFLQASPFLIPSAQICTKMSEDPTLLHFFFTCGSGQGGQQFAVFHNLVRFLYEPGDVGQLARDALLLILHVSAKTDEIAQFIAYKSDFCPVVSTGLSGCFSQLGRVLGEGGDRPLFPEDIDAREALEEFRSALMFCNAVAQEDKEEAVSATAYLTLCIETITEAALLEKLLRLVLVETTDRGIPLVDVVVSRLSAADRLSHVSLCLLSTLIELRNEDVLLALVFRPLLTLRHSTRQQLAKTRDRALSVKTSSFLLDCVPQCTLKFPAISSSATVKSYVAEGAMNVERSASAMSEWRFTYDGQHPSPSMLCEDDGMSAHSHSAFTRLSSLRSSLSNAAVGLNRYFSSRSRHATDESRFGVGGADWTGKLVELGARSISHSDEEFDEESPIEDESFVLPPISNAMTSSTMDYLQLYAYDDLSESEFEDAKPEHEPLKRTENVNLSSETESSAFDTEAEMARSFVLRGWGDVQDIETFEALLEERVTLPKKKQPTSLAENMSFIDSKLQYMRELHEEEAADEDDEEEIDNKVAETLPVRGCVIDADWIEADGSTLFLDSLLELLENLPSLPYLLAVELCTTLTLLASYPQPLITAFLFFSPRHDETKLARLLQVMKDVRERVDAYAREVDGFDVWVERAVKGLRARAERSLRNGDSPRFREDARFRVGGGSGRRDGDHQFRYFSHKAIESADSIREGARTKGVVHAAVLLACLAQSLAGAVFHYSLVVPPHTKS